MTPTLVGRIQTRIFLMATVGALWTLIITPFLPGVTDRGLAYSITYLSLGIITLIGIVWEFIYHGLQQFRWEKDWPTVLGLITGIPEGIVAWLVLRQLVAPGLVTGTQFVIHFATTWFLVWLVANGPMRVLSLHWRFEGGRLV